MTAKILKVLLVIFAIVISFSLASAQRGGIGVTGGLGGYGAGYGYGGYGAGYGYGGYGIQSGYGASPGYSTGYGYGSGYGAGRQYGYTDVGGAQGGYQRGFEEGEYVDTAQLGDEAISRPGVNEGGPVNEFF